jgi:hypothetical protein
MGTYKDDSDRFHEMREERERELAEAETWQKFIAFLEANGVNVEEFVDGLKKVDAGLKRMNVSADFRRDLVVKAFWLRLGLDEEKPN